MIVMSKSVMAANVVASRVIVAVFVAGRGVAVRLHGGGALSVFSVGRSVLLLKELSE